MYRMTDRDLVTMFCGDEQHQTWLAPWEMNPDHIKQALNRLADYEDTGLTPEEVLIQQGYVEGMKENLRIMYGDTSVQRLMELAKADKEGRCVVLTEDVYLAKTMREAAEAALKEGGGDADTTD